jgi:hypothetical protein
MNSLHNGPSTLGEIFQSLHHRSCRKRIQTSRGLIQKDKIWISDELNTDTCPFPLTSRNTLDKWSSDLSVLTFSESQLSDDLLHSILFLLHGALKF